MRDIISYREGANFVQLESNQDAFTSFSEFGWEQSITTGQGWAYGAEFLARKKTGKLRGWLGYTLSWAQRQFDQLNNGQKFSARYDRRHDLSFVTTYAPSKKITLSANWILSSGLNYTIQDKLTVSNYDNLFGDLNTNTPPSPIEYASERNNLKGATYHRLDLGIQFHKKKKKNRERTWAFSIYNAYNRKNAALYYQTTEGFNPNTVKLKKLSILQMVPSFSYTCKF